MSTKRSKRYQEAAKLVIPNKNYSITEAVETMKSFPAPKFDPTVTVSFHLTVDPRKSDQMVRGSVSLPNGTGKNVRVLVFAQGDAAKAAQEAGAEFVGFEDLIKKVQGGFVDFDTAIATPDAMTEVRLPNDVRKHPDGESKNLPSPASSGLLQYRANHTAAPAYPS